MARRRYVPFEGSFGYGRDRVATGWSRVALRHLDPLSSQPWEPVPTCTDEQPLQPDEVVAVNVALGPSATLFRAGEQLRLVVAGRWRPTQPVVRIVPVNLCVVTARARDPALARRPRGAPADSRDSSGAHKMTALTDVGEWRGRRMRWQPTSPRS